jgi:hypothetical protein
MAVCSICLLEEGCISLISLSKDGAKGWDILKRIMKSVSAILALSLTITLVGCEDDSAVFNGEIEGYSQMTDRIDHLLEGISIDVADIPLADEFNKADRSQRSELAMNLADDMAYAQFFNVVTDDMLVMAGNAVKAYPHPLLLNNYASMLYSHANRDDALYFFLLALNQEPGNPFLLTNIANLYIDIDDFAAARLYAEEALRTLNDFGSAYQVLTTINLHDELYELAAETMIKSAKHAFNDVTIDHFESFLDAVGGLDPEVDDYPLDEAFLDELYKIAKENVDSVVVDGSVDTPEAQIKIKPFPTLGGTDHLMSSEQYLRGQDENIQAKWDEAHSAVIGFDSAYNRALNPEGRGEGVYPIVKNMRQIYAYEVLESFYEFKLKQKVRRFINKDKQLRGIRSEQLDHIKKTYEPQHEEIDRIAREELGHPIALLFEMIAGTKSEGDVAKELKRARELSIRAAKLKVEQENAEFDAHKQYANRMMNESQTVYHESKQIVEEYWLKSGGLLKYMTDEAVFNKMNARREMLVYDYTGDCLGTLADIASELNSAKRDVTFAEEILAELLGNGMDELLEQLIPEEEEGENLVPDIEEQAIGIYPEPGDIGEFTAEASLFGHSVAFTADGENIEISADSLFFGSVAASASLTELGNYKITTLHNVKGEINTEWFKDSKALKKIFETSKTTGKLAKGAWKIGKIGVGVSKNMREGTYTSMSGFTVTDRGEVKVREEGAELGPLGKSKKTEFTKSTFPSKMTTVATKKTSTKYKFKYFSHQVSE